jgi:2-oxoglutarate ferredoxin oxidoreductase subunit gamma
MTGRLIFAGSGGQGVILAGKLLCVAAMQLGKYVSHIPSYGAEMRGGTANCSVVISDAEIPSPLVFSPDICLVFNSPSLVKFGPQVRKGGVLFYNSSLITAAPEIDGVSSIPVPANDLAEQAGSYKAANMVMIGALIARHPELATLEAVINALPHAVSSRNKEFNALNARALEAGFAAELAPARS